MSASHAPGGAHSVEMVTPEDLQVLVSTKYVPVATRRNVLATILSSMDERLRLQTNLNRAVEESVRFAAENAELKVRLRRYEDEARFQDARPTSSGFQSTVHHLELVSRLDELEQNEKLPLATDLSMLHLDDGQPAPGHDDSELQSLLHDLGFQTSLGLSKARFDSCGLEQMVEVVVFSHKEPVVEECGVLLPSHVIALGFRPDVATKIASQAAIYNSVTSHRAAVVLAALHFLPRATPLPPWMESVPKNTAVQITGAAAGLPADRTITALRINYPEYVEGKCDEVLDSVLNPLEGRRLLFHGTDVASAVRIAQRGISLTRGRPAQDFSVSDHPGYYVGDNFQVAMDRAYQRQREDEQFCAVLVHDLSADVESRGLSVTGREWESLVLSCRRDDSWPEATESASPVCISGNMCANPQFLGPPYNRAPTDQFERGVRRYQLCVVDANLAVEFSRAITKVVFVFSPAIRR